MAEREIERLEALVCSYTELARAIRSSYAYLDEIGSPGRSLYVAELLERLPKEHA